MSPQKDPIEQARTLVELRDQYYAEFNRIRQEVGLDNIQETADQLYQLHQRALKRAKQIRQAAATQATKKPKKRKRLSPAERRDLVRRTKRAEIFKERQIRRRLLRKMAKEQAQAMKEAAGHKPTLPEKCDESHLRAQVGGSNS